MNIIRRIIAGIKNEWPLKALAIVLAIVLWGYVISRDNPPTQEQKKLLVEAVNVPQNLITTSIQPSEVEVTFQGRRRAMAAADLQAVSLTADLSGRPTGEHTVSLAVQGLPANINAVLGTRLVRVTLDSQTSIEREVTVETVGKQAEGFRLGRARVSPGQGTIIGASRALREVELAVATVDISGLNTTLQKEVAVELRDDRNVRIANLQTTPATVKVVVPITKVATRTVPLTPRLSDPPESYKVSSVQTSPSTVTITGNEQDIEKVEYISTVQIEIGNLRGSRTFTPSLVFPDRVNPVGIAAATVKVITERVALPQPPASEPPGGGTGEAGSGSSGAGAPELSPDESDGTGAPADESPPANTPGENPEAG